MSVVGDSVDSMKIELTKRKAEELAGRELTDKEWDYITSGIVKYIDDYFYGEIDYYLTELAEDS